MNTKNHIEEDNQNVFYPLNKEELHQVEGGKKVAVPIEGTQWHTDTDCCQMWEIQRSFMGIKLKSRIVPGGCSHMFGNCAECCEVCTYRPGIGAMVE